MLHLGLMSGIRVGKGSRSDGTSALPNNQPSEAQPLICQLSRRMLLLDLDKPRWTPANRQSALEPPIVYRT